MRRTQPRLGVLHSLSPVGESRPLSAREGRKELLISWLFRTCIRLQTSLDRRFLRFGMTAQEASVLLRCVQAEKVTPGRLAVALGRDKGKITRFIDRLEKSRLVTRDIHPRDRRFSIIKPTGKGKQVARELACVFDNIRKELFVGILESDVLRLGKLLPQLHKNAVRIGSGQKCDASRGRKRIGSQELKTDRKQTSTRQIAADILTASPSGHAANTVPIEHEGHESALKRHEQNSEKNTTAGKLMEEHKELVFK